MLSRKLERERLRQLELLRIMDTPQDPILDELCHAAALFCETPTAVVSLLDGKRQWFKARYGTHMVETPQSISFCQYTLSNPDSVLEIPNALEDERVKDSPLVTGETAIRFYAGAPLVTDNNYVMGTLCVISTKPHRLTENQKEGLQLLAKKVMRHIDAQNLLADQQQKLEALRKQIPKDSDKLPAAFIEFHMDAKRNIHFDHISHGISKLMPGFDREFLLGNFRQVMGYIHPEDYPKLIKAVFQAYNNQEPWELEYRVLLLSGVTSWQKVFVKPQKSDNGVVHMYGEIYEISESKRYERLLEEITFDISHVLRRPVTTLIGLMNLIEASEDVNPEQLRFFAKNTRAVAEELDTFTRQLATLYTSKLDENLPEHIKNNLSTLNIKDIRRFKS